MILMWRETTGQMTFETILNKYQVYLRGENHGGTKDKVLLDENLYEYLANPGLCALYFLILSRISLALFIDSMRLRRSR